MPDTPEVDRSPEALEERRQRLAMIVGTGEATGNNAVPTPPASQAPARKPRKDKGTQRPRNDTPITALSMEILQLHNQVVEAERRFWSAEMELHQARKAHAAALDKLTAK
jgi:hypothetical protein